MPWFNDERSATTVSVFPEAIIAWLRSVWRRKYGQPKIAFICVRTDNLGSPDCSRLYTSVASATLDCGISQGKEPLVDAPLYASHCKRRGIDYRNKTLRESALVPRRNFHSVFYWACAARKIRSRRHCSRNFKTRKPTFRDYHQSQTALRTFSVQKVQRGNEIISYFINSMTNLQVRSASVIFFHNFLSQFSTLNISQQT